MEYLQFKSASLPSRFAGAALVSVSIRRGLQETQYEAVSHSRFITEWAAWNAGSPLYCFYDA